MYLVEVKYRSSINPEDIKAIATALLKRWNPSWLFVGNPGGFYCAPSSSIATDGKISRLAESWVAADRQKRYLDLLNEFEKR